MGNENLDLLLDLTNIESDTNTVMEQDVEKYVYEYFDKIEYFNKNQTFGLWKVKEDELNRGIVWGLIKGKNPKTIILLNHHDVVDSNDYGALKKYAYTPNKLKEALKEMHHSPDVIADLENEDWLFGRGTADMKAGLSIQLNIMKKYCEKENFDGSILFMSVPDEENLSLGMRSGSTLMNELQEKYGLSYHLLINSEPHERVEDKYTIYDGSVGKSMATFYVQGKKTHIGKIFEGLNPSMILSRIILKTELNSKLCDSDLGETSPPPSWSFARDFKECYDASIPESAGGYMSCLTLNSSPKDLLMSLKEISRNAFNESVSYLREQYVKIHPNSENVPDYKANVKLYQELLSDAKGKDLAGTERVLAACIKEIKTKLRQNSISLPESNFIIIKALLEIAAYNVPTIVIALSPPFYPHVSSQKNESHQKIIETLMACTKSFDIKKESYFMGISDLSYVGLQNSEEIVPYVAPNMPLWGGEIYTIPFEKMKAISIPSVIIGPWGKDLHKMTERVYIPDLSSKTPLIIETIIETML